ncbi:Histidinol dehydrogenase [Flavobacteriaceae bacterium 3519-10]|nr:Histidinol dehydrogenase [Flavobacteriaceae bacterium 3519-10]
MNTIYKYPPREIWKNLISRNVLKQENLKAAVQEIFDQVAENGDCALKQLTLKYDRAELETFLVSESEINAAEALVSEKLKAAIATAKANIYTFHAAQKEDFGKIETMPGVSCWRVSRAIAKVGLYIPGGSAPLFSTVLMLAVPAQIAGCREVILCTPPRADGSIDPAVLFTAKLCGISKIYKVGGAQAIAAMNFGTESIPKVDKIFGPGNQYVTQAKMLATDYNIAVDLPAGPSEVLVIADRTAVPAFCAADLLAQAEHGTDSQVIFIAVDEEIFTQTLNEVSLQLEMLPRRDIAAEALENSRFILLDSVESALEFSNLYAPEHLILSVERAEDYLNDVASAGSVFLGNYTPESVGDYASGTNHTLPTNGFASSYSGVSLDSFVKKITVQQITVDGLQNIGQTVEIMAEAEGLSAHKNAVSIRLKMIKDGI